MFPPIPHPFTTSIQCYNGSPNQCNKAKKRNKKYTDLNKKNYLYL